MRYLVLIILAATSIVAQSNSPVWVSAGFKIGSPLNDPSDRSNVFSTYNQSRWTGGPTVELHLPYHFSIEFDALYRNERSNSAYPFQLTPSANAYVISTIQKTNDWDLPLLLKYRFKVGPIHPFVSGGYSWTHQSSKGAAAYTCSGPAATCLSADYPQPLQGGSFHSSGFQSGPAGGVGLEFKTRFLTISPEMRYSHQRRVPTRVMDDLRRSSDLRLEKEKTRRKSFLL